MLILIIALGVFVGLCLFQIRTLIFAVLLGLVLLAAAHSAPVIAAICQ